MADYSNCVSTNFVDWNVEKDFFKFCLKLMGFERRSCEALNQLELKNMLELDHKQLDVYHIK